PETPRVITGLDEIRPGLTSPVKEAARTDAIGGRGVVMIPAPPRVVGIELPGLLRPGGKGGKAGRATTGGGKGRQSHPIPVVPMHVAVRDHRQGRDDVEFIGLWGAGAVEAIVTVSAVPPIILLMVAPRNLGLRNGAAQFFERFGQGNLGLRIVLDDTGKPRLR